MPKCSRIEMCHPKQRIVRKRDASLITAAVRVQVFCRLVGLQLLNWRQPQAEIAHVPHSPGEVWVALTSASRPPSQKLKTRRRRQEYTRFVKRANPCGAVADENDTRK